ASTRRNCSSRLLREPNPEDCPVSKTYEELKNRLASIHDLHMARSILGWDQHTKMPPRGGEVRAEQLSTLDRFSHELFIDDEIGRLLEELRDYEEQAGYDPRA